MHCGVYLVCGVGRVGKGQAAASEHIEDAAAERKDINLVTHTHRESWVLPHKCCIGAVTCTNKCTHKRTHKRTNMLHLRGGSLAAVHFGWVEAKAAELTATTRARGERLVRVHGVDVFRQTEVRDLERAVEAVALE